MTTGSEPHKESDNRLTSEKFDEFREALEVLYILANMGGRINFAREWPDAALHILGEQLLAFDRDGTSDRELRATLESEAEDRRLALLDALDTLEDSSVKAGALQVEYVEKLVRSLGRGLSLYIYSERIVDRFIPPPPPPVEEIVSEAVAEEPAQPEVPTYIPPVIGAPEPVQPVQQAAANVEEEIIPLMPDDPLAFIQPISLQGPEKIAELEAIKKPEEGEDEKPPAALQTFSATFVSSKSGGTGGSGTA